MLPTNGRLKTGSPLPAPLLLESFYCLTRQSWRLCKHSVRTLHGSGSELSGDEEESIVPVLRDPQKLNRSDQLLCPAHE